MLQGYTGEARRAVGQIKVMVTTPRGRKELSLILTDVEGRATLLGRDWLSALKLDWSTVCRVDHVTASALDDVLAKVDDVFSGGGLLKDTKASFTVDPTVPAVFIKARPVPFAIRARVGAEIDRLEQAGIIERVTTSDWAAPIVPVLKADGVSIRICGDFRATINSAIKIDTYPIPKIDDLYATLAGGTLFSKLDLSNAYLQVEIRKDDRKYTTINTQQGLYEYKESNTRHNTCA